MKIGIDVSQTGSSKAGCGYFADNLTRSLAKVDHINKYILYPTFGDSFWSHQYLNVVKIKQANFKRNIPHFTQKGARKFWRSFSEKSLKRLGDVNIIHANNFFCPARTRNTKIVYTLYDLSFLEYPEYTTERNRLTCFKGVLNASINADHVIAISHFSRQHFLNTFPYFPEGKISVHYPASRFNNVASCPCPQKI